MCIDDKKTRRPVVLQLTPGQSQTITVTIPGTYNFEFLEIVGYQFDGVPVAAGVPYSLFFTLGVSSSNLTSPTLCTKFAILRLLGPRTREDFMYLWLVQTGRVPLIQGPLWDPSKWEQAGPEKKYALFNPWKMLSSNNAPNNVDTLNRTDPLGNPGSRFNAADPNQGMVLRRDVPLWNGYKGYRAAYGANYGNPVGQAGIDRFNFGAPNSNPVFR